MIAFYVEWVLISKNYLIIIFVWGPNPFMTLSVMNHIGWTISTKDSLQWYQGMTKFVSLNSHIFECHPESDILWSPIVNQDHMCNVDEDK